MGVLNGLDKFLWDLKIQRLADEGIECVYILASHSISVRFAEWESVKSIVIIFWLIFEREYLWLFPLWCWIISVVDLWVSNNGLLFDVANVLQEGVGEEAWGWGCGFVVGFVVIVVIVVNVVMVGIVVLITIMLNIPAAIYTTTIATAIIIINLIVYHPYPPTTA